MEAAWEETDIQDLLEKLEREEISEETCEEEYSEFNERLEYMCREAVKKISKTMQGFFQN